MLKAWPISAFPEIKQGETQESFMRKVSDMLQGRLINVPLLIRYIDQDGFVTKEMQKAFETEVGLALALEQKHLFSPFDANADGAVSLKEIAEHEHVQIAHAVHAFRYLQTALRNIQEMAPFVATITEPRPYPLLESGYFLLTHIKFCECITILIIAAVFNRFPKIIIESQQKIPFIVPLSLYFSNVQMIFYIL